MLLSPSTAEAQGICHKKINSELSQFCGTVAARCRSDETSFKVNFEI